jgi:hypothetical protein
LLIRAADLRVNEEDWFEGCEEEIGPLTQAVVPPFRDEAETGKHGSAAASEAKMATVYLRLLDDRARPRVSFHVAMDARVVGVAPYRVQTLSGLSGG